MTLHHYIDDASLAGPVSFDRAAGARRACLSVAVILSDGFSMMALSSITDALCLASRSGNDQRVKTNLFGVMTAKPRSRSGVQVRADATLRETPGDAGLVCRFDVLFICTGDTLSADDKRVALRLVRSARLYGRRICVIGGAIRTIAESGLVSVCTDHWSRTAVLQETVPSVAVSNTIFRHDRHVVTSPGEMATLDYVLNLVHDRFGADRASEISAFLLVDKVRMGSSQQPCSAAQRFRGIPEKVVDAIEMIEGNIAEPCSPGAVAEALGVSVRQLERLFRKHIGISPQRFRRTVQLEHGLNLLQQSSMSTIEVALACGFERASTFNRQFRRTYGVTPKQLREPGACLPLSFR